MLGSSFLPARLRSSDSEHKHYKPTWLSQRINPFLLSLSGRACAHPIYTIVSVAIIASTTYLGLLESSLFDRQTSLAGAGGSVDFDSLLVGSKRLYAGAESNWNWQIQENGHDKKVDNVSSCDQVGSLDLTCELEFCPYHLRFSQLCIKHPSNCSTAKICSCALEFHR